MDERNYADPGELSRISSIGRQRPCASGYFGICAAFAASGLNVPLTWRKIFTRTSKKCLHAFLRTPVSRAIRPNPIFVHSLDPGQDLKCHSIDNLVFLRALPLAIFLWLSF